MADPITCPNCAAAMEADRDHRDFACANCGLAGPADVLAKLRATAVRLMASRSARIRTQDVAADAFTRIYVLQTERDALKTPAHVLGEAERLLREAGALRADLDGPPHDFGDFVTLWTANMSDPESARGGVDFFSQDTLAEAYAKLVEARNG